MGLPAPDEFGIDVHKLHQMSLIIVHGAIDLSNIHVLEDAVDHVVQREVPLLFDLTQVCYIDSTGLHFMQQVHDRCASKNVPFAVAASAMIRRLCSLLSLEAVIPIFANTTAARDYFLAEWRRPLNIARVPS